MLQLSDDQRDKVIRVVHGLVDDVLDEKTILEVIEGLGLPPADTKRTTALVAELLGHTPKDGWQDQSYLKAHRDHWGIAHNRTIRTLRQEIATSTRVAREQAKADA